MEQSPPLEDLFQVANDETCASYAGLSILARVCEEEGLSSTTVPDGPLPPCLSSYVGLRQPVNEYREAFVPGSLPAPSTTNSRDYYLMACSMYDVRPNTQVAMNLSAIDGDYTATSISLQGNYIGERGLLPVLEVARVHPSLTHFIIPAVGAERSAAEWVAEAFMRHPSVRYIDVSGNHISIGGGKALEFMVRCNRAIVSVNIDDTLIDANTAHRLMLLCKHNATLAAEGFGRRTSMTPVA